MGRDRKSPNPIDKCAPKVHVLTSKEQKYMLMFSLACAKRGQSESVTLVLHIYSRFYGLWGKHARMSHREVRPFVVLNGYNIAACHQIKYIDSHTKIAAV
eukprot:1189073-Prorocentrum_minimum.AAC.2